MAEASAGEASKVEVLPVSIHEAAGELRAGRLTSVSMTLASLRLIDAQDDRYGSFVTVMKEEALAAAQAADDDLSAGRARGPLHGIPLAVKDVIATKDAPTTANSRAIDPQWGAGRDAAVVSSLRAAGAVIVGKTTTSEYACGLPDETKGFAIPRNPWNLSHTPLGSSSGTGIAVSTGMVLGGLGTDTGGSVRAPAAVCGCTGLKPTHGRVPKSGVVPLGYTLDTVGPLARSAADCATIMDAISVYEKADPASLEMAPAASMGASLREELSGVRVGIPRAFFYDHPSIDAEVHDATLAVSTRLAELGATLVEVSVSFPQEAHDASNVIFLAEAFAYHRTNLVNQWQDYGESARDLLARGALVSGADYVQAQRVRRAFRREPAVLFKDIDVILTPGAPAPAPRRDEMDMQNLFTGAGFWGQWNLAGVPAATGPSGFSSKHLPLSFQVVGRPFEDVTVLSTLHAYQLTTDWHQRVPPIESPAVVSSR